MLRIKNIIKKVPGFRSNKWWKMLIACIVYCFVAYRITHPGGVTLTDKIIYNIKFFIIFFIPFSLTTNIANIRVHCRFIIKKVPGFRSGTLWKGIIAAIYYFFIIILLANPNGITIGDKAISITNTIIIFLVPYFLVLNIGDIRNKLPIFSKRSLKYNILGSFVVAILIVSTGIWLDNFQSIEYKEQKVLARVQAEADREARKLEEAVQIQAQSSNNQNDTVVDAKNKVQEELDINNINPPTKVSIFNKLITNINEYSQKRKEEKLKAQEEKKAKLEAEEKKKADKEAKAKAEYEENARKEVEVKTRTDAEVKARLEAEAKAKEEAEMIESLEYYKKGSNAFNSGNYQMAIEYLLKVRFNDPNFNTANELLDIAFRENYVSECARYEYREIIKNADNFKTKKVVFTGSIVQIQEINNKSIIILSTTNLGNESWKDDIVLLYNKPIDVYAGDVITIYGEIRGKYLNQNQYILKWLNTDNVYIRYKLSTDVGNMPVIDAKYIEEGSARTINANSNTLITEDEAMDLVGEKVSNKYSEFSLMFDRSENVNGREYYVVWVFSDMQTHVSTLGYYYVDTKTGLVHEYDISADKIVPIN